MATNVYEDPRLAEVKENEAAVKSEVYNLYGGMAAEAEEKYNEWIDATNDWAKQQTALQNEQTAFTIEQINQQKAQAEKDYTKEQAGAYVDWQKQSNQYGANAEQMAASGMQNTGYSESSQVSMYNTYQNRVATARESYSRAVLNYDNAIKDAQLQNSAALAQIAYQTLQTQLQLSLEGFQYRNSLISTGSDKALAVSESYHNRYQDVLAQINTDRAFDEQQRQFNVSLAEQQRQYNASLAAQGGSPFGVEDEDETTAKGNGIEVTPNNDTSAYHTSNGSGGFDGNTYSAAVARMKLNGVPDEITSGLMTEAEWNRRGDSVNKTYKDYITKYVNFYAAAGKNAATTKELATTLSNAGYVSPSVDGILSALSKNDGIKGTTLTANDLKLAFSSLGRGQTTNAVVEKQIDELFKEWRKNLSELDAATPTVEELLGVWRKMTK